MNLTFLEHYPMPFITNFLNEPQTQPLCEFNCIGKIRIIYDPYDKKFLIAKMKHVY